ncbi:MAG: ApbE family lipoprotein [Herminiimonas sp.]|nr:ApbE family lipoprotein [Herminiimonas sp.]MDB5855581.1 ApbE family lipoprotein [Herminiimonas sp.]
MNAPGMGPARMRLSDGRWHFQHGPIDIVLRADGDATEVDRATERAWQCFADILPRLVSELPQLRQPIPFNAPVPSPLKGPVALRMLQAVWPYRAGFITPMAAVAGAVGDELMKEFSGNDGVQRAFINNGGDIALHLTPGQQYRVGLFADLDKLRLPDVDGSTATMALDADFCIAHAMPVRGIATSGWRGRSFSLGIADSVTVLAANAASADAAATMIANAVNAQHPAIRRAAASSIKDDSDLGDLPVTVEVGILPDAVVQQSLHDGAARAASLLRQGLIVAAVLCLQGRYRAVGIEELQPHVLLPAAHCG